MRNKKILVLVLLLVNLLSLSVIQTVTADGFGGGSFAYFHLEPDQSAFVGGIVSTWTTGSVNGTVMVGHELEYARFYVKTNQTINIIGYRTNLTADQIGNITHPRSGMTQFLNMTLTNGNVTIQEELGLDGFWYFFNETLVVPYFIFEISNPTNESVDFFYSFFTMWHGIYELISGGVIHNIEDPITPITTTVWIDSRTTLLAIGFGFGFILISIGLIGFYWQRKRERDQIEKAFEDNQ